MKLEILSRTDKDFYEDSIIDMLNVSDREFVPPLSKRSSTTQSDLSDRECSESGIIKYYKEMKKQEILGAFENGELIGIVSFRENYVCDVIAEDTLPNIYISTLVIKPEARGKHLTSQMYDYLFNRLYPEKNVFTRTWSTNAAHTKILDSFGFCELYRRKNDRGAGIDTVYFVRKCREMAAV